MNIDVVDVENPGPWLIKMKPCQPNAPFRLAHRIGLLAVLARRANTSCWWARQCKHRLIVTTVTNVQSDACLDSRLIDKPAMRYIVEKLVPILNLKVSVTVKKLSLHLPHFTRLNVLCGDQ